MNRDRTLIRSRNATNNRGRFGRGGRQGGEAGPPGCEFDQFEVDATDCDVGVAGGGADDVVTHPRLARPGLTADQDVRAAGPGQQERSGVEPAADVQAGAVADGCHSGHLPIITVGVGLVVFVVFDEPQRRRVGRCGVVLEVGCGFGPWRW